MWLVVLGVLLTVLKLLGISVFAGLSWWWVLLPFALAALWWKFADASGITQRDAMAREDERAAQRREAQFESLGMRPPKAGSRRVPPQSDNKSKRGDG